MAVDTNERNRSWSCGAACQDCNWATRTHIERMSEKVFTEANKHVRSTHHTVHVTTIRTDEITKAV